MLIILKSFSSGKFTLLDSIYEILGSLVFQCAFLNFFFKESAFGFLDNSFEFFPIFQWLRGLISIQFDAILFILPWFRTFSNINIFGKFISSRIWNFCIFLNYVFKRFFAWYICCINIFQGSHKLSDNFLFFLTVLNNSLLLILNKFFTDKYVIN